MLTNLTLNQGKTLKSRGKKELKSWFVKIINKNQSNDIVEVIYRHPKMETSTLDSLR